MKRLSSHVLRILLFVAVATSVILSWLIWTNNAKYQPDTQFSSVQSVSHHPQSLSKNTNMNEVFAPTKLIVTQNNQSQLIYNYKYSTVDEIFQVLQHTRLFGLRQIVQKDEHQYQKFLNYNDSLQMIYPTTVSCNVFAKAVHQPALHRARDFNLRRVMLVMDWKTQQARLYLLNDPNYTIYQVQVRHLNAQRLKKLLQAQNFVVNVNQAIFNKKIQLFYTQPVRLKVISYLMTLQDDNSYISNLLGTKQVSDITSHTSGNQVIYRNGNRLLRVDHNTGLVSYTNYAKMKVPPTTSATFVKAYQNLVETGNSLTGLHLYRYLPRSRQVIFRNFAEGFPIFHSGNTGATDITFTKNGTTMNFSKKILQVPVPTSQKEIQLPTTAEVLTSLKKFGYNIHNIQDLSVGYTWTQDSQNKSIIDLVPRYYIRMNDQWKSLDEWLNPER